MSNLINICEFEIVNGKKLSNRSKILKTAVRNIIAKNKFHIEENERVISPAKLLLMCYEISSKKIK